MTSIPNSMSMTLASAREVSATPIKSSEADAAEFSARQAVFDSARTGLDPSIRENLLTKQNNTQAHTVFRQGGKIVAVQYQDGSTIYPSGGDIGGSAAAQKEAQSMGLDRSAQNDFVSARMEDNLKRAYGAGLSVELYSSGSGPTQGKLTAEINALASPPSRVSLDAQMLAYLNNG